MAKDIRSTQVEPICKPFGPFKLARAICRALERAAKAPTTSEYVEMIKTPSSVSSRALSSSPQRGRIFIDRDDASSIDSRTRSPQPSPPGEKRPLLSHHAAVSNLSVGNSKAVRASQDGGFPFPRKDHDPTKSAGKSPVPTPHGKEAAKVRPPYRGDGQVVSHPEHDRNTSSMSAKTLERVQKASNAPAVGRNARASDTASSTTGATSAWNVPSFPQKRKPVVLLVDDNQINLDLLQTYVTRKGYGADIIKTAADGQEAVDAFNRYDPDIVFMDLSMPVMNGHEATRTIRRIESDRRASSERVPTLRSLQNPSSPLDPPTPVSPAEGGSKMKKPSLVVALTGNSKDCDQTEAFDSGVDIYMTKPVSFKQVGKLLENWREETKEEAEEMEAMERNQE